MEEANEEEIRHNGKTYTEAQLLYLIDEVKDYQINHGSLLKAVQFETSSSVPSRPVGASILPTPFPRRCFDEAIELQHAFHELYMRAASDAEWLYSVLEPLMGHDDLLSTLWDIYVKVRDAGAVQSTVCAVFRSDYMLHQPTEAENPCIKQVEMNTFSCAGAAHAERIANMHQHLSRVSHASDPSVDPAIPINTNVASIVNLLKTSYETYKSSCTSSNRPKCILMTVQPFNFNIADERPIVYGLWDASIPCYRCEWPSILSQTTLTSDRTLLFRPPLGPAAELEVSVIYHRAGYEAEEYSSQGKTTRLRLEMSRAIKCPDILSHLAGFKSIQQALTPPATLERFLPSAEKASRIRKTFMPMHFLLAHEEEAVLDPAQAANYILKPNLEGGGHNIHRAEIPAFLASQPRETWRKYILMRRIEPPASTTGLIMMPEDLHHGAVVSELGVLGACLWERTGDGGVEVKVDEVAGWTFKTKPAGVDEMSVVKGHGCFDCPWLVDE